MECSPDLRVVHEELCERAYTRLTVTQGFSAKTAVVHSDPEIMSGTPVFVGTRVPVKSLFDYLAAGDSLDEFFEDFPSVSREQAIAALEQAREMTEAHACGDPGAGVQP